MPNLLMILYISKVTGVPYILMILHISKVQKNLQNPTCNSSKDPYSSLYLVIGGSWAFNVCFLMFTKLKAFPHTLNLKLCQPKICYYAYLAKGFAAICHIVAYFAHSRICWSQLEWGSGISSGCSIQRGGNQDFDGDPERSGDPGVSS